VNIRELRREHRERREIGQARAHLAVHLRARLIQSTHLAFAAQKATLLQSSADRRMRIGA